MKNSLMKITLGLALASFGVSAAYAQDNTNAPKSSTRTITGCVQTSGNDHYNLIGENGGTWNLKSSERPLAEHVGHEVTVTGTVARATAHNLKEDTKQAETDTGVKKNNSEHGTLNVTELKMVSKTCTNK